MKITLSRTEAEVIFSILDAEKARLEAIDIKSLDSVKDLTKIVKNVTVVKHFLAAILEQCKELSW